MTWDELDWPALDRLRDGFLRGAAAEGPYWRSERDLASYNLTYGERIGWKWDAVLAELRLRGWTPPGGLILDWGCGSGVAGRRVIDAFGLAERSCLRVWDHSPLARTFAEAEARRRFPRADVGEWSPGEPVGTLVVSHVLNELDEAGRTQLVALAREADAVLWVEPGTHADSRALLPWREQLRSTHRVIAPCTHERACGLLAPDRDRDWCHHFARPPAGVQADSRWVRFAQRAGIDLRSLPYSFLVLERREVRPAPPPWPAGAGRLLGRPEFFKPYARALLCDETGLTDLTIPKRTAGAVYKQLEKARGPLVYRWIRDGGTVQDAAPLLRPEPVGGSEPNV